MEVEAGFSSGRQDHKAPVIEGVTRGSLKKRLMGEGGILVGVIAQRHVAAGAVGADVGRWLGTQQRLVRGNRRAERVHGLRRAQDVRRVEQLGFVGRAQRGAADRLRRGWTKRHRN